MNFQQSTRDFARNEKNDRILNLADMVLSLNKNNLNDEKKITDLFDIYLGINELNLSNTFKCSLLDSKTCITEPWMLGPSLSHLKKNNPESFVITLVRGKGHLWSTLIRKNDEGYSVTVINKGLRFFHKINEEYVFASDKLDNLLSTLRTISLPSHYLVEDIYRLLSKNSDNKYILNTSCAPQKTGNCFVKNTEAAIKFAYATSEMAPSDLKSLRVCANDKEGKQNASLEDFNTLQQSNTLAPNLPQTILRKFQFGSLTGIFPLKELSGFEAINAHKINLPFKPKWKSLPTAKIHQLFAQKLAERNPDISLDLQNKLKLYLQNKKFGELIQSGNSPLQSFIEAFDFERKNIDITKYQPPEDLLKRISLNTIKKHSDAVGELIQSANNPSYSEAYSTLLRSLKEFLKINCKISFRKYMENGEDALSSFFHIWCIDANNLKDKPEILMKSLKELDNKTLIDYKSDTLMLIQAACEINPNFHPKNVEPKLLYNEIYNNLLEESCKKQQEILLSSQQAIVELKKIADFFPQPIESMVQNWKRVCFEYGDSVSTYRLY